MRISDWSSDVCSSDLSEAEFRHCINLAIRVDHLACGPQRPESSRVPMVCGAPIVTKAKDGFLTSEKQTLAIGKLPASDIWPKIHRTEPTLRLRQDKQLGRASCRERVCQYV